MIDSILTKEKKELKKERSKGKPFRQFLRRIMIASTEELDSQQVLTTATEVFGESAVAADVVRNIWQRCVLRRRAREKRDDNKKRIRCRVAERRGVLSKASSGSIGTYKHAFLTHDGNVEDDDADLHVEPEGDARTQLHRQLQRQIAQEQVRVHRQVPLRTRKLHAPRAKAEAKEEKDEVTVLGDDAGWFLTLGRN